MLWDPNLFKQSSHFFSQHLGKHGSVVYLSAGLLPIATYPYPLCVSKPAEAHSHQLGRVYSPHWGVSCRQQLQGLPSLPPSSTGSPWQNGSSVFSICISVLLKLSSSSFLENKENTACFLWIGTVLANLLSSLSLFDLVVKYLSWFSWAKMLPETEDLNFWDKWCKKIFKKLRRFFLLLVWQFVF